MQGWHTTFLGMRGLPRDISDFEMKAFFTFDGAERDAINARRGDSHKLGLGVWGVTEQEMQLRDQVIWCHRQSGRVSVFAGIFWMG
jgi:hypothetical protein